MNAGVYFVTQNSDDLLDERLKNNIGLKFAFRSNITGIEATIQPYRDFNNYVKELRACINKEDTFDSEFGSLIDKLTKNSITNHRSTMFLQKTYSNRKSSIFSDKKLINSIRKLNDAQVLELQTLKPNDLVVIRLELNGKKVRSIYSGKCL
ncbi:hypothetical protein EfmAA96_18940 [Enterococcus faecium]|nr:hypothetical protein EfmAA96_18940 [Enterococcus faecium]